MRDSILNGQRECVLLVPAARRTLLRLMEAGTCAKQYVRGLSGTVTGSTDTQVLQSAPADVGEQRLPMCGIHTCPLPLQLLGCRRVVQQRSIPTGQRQAVLQLGVTQQAKRIDRLFLQFRNTQV